MAKEKEIKGRIVNKHGLPSDWKKATGFIPMEGEIIVYEPEGEIDHSRIKIGDGVTNVNDLPFNLSYQKNNSLVGGSIDSGILSSIAGITVSNANLSEAKATAPNSLSFGMSTVANGTGSVALGMISNSGAKGYYWTSINGNVITLSTKRTSQTKPSSLNWAIGDYITIANGTTYAFCSRITAVDKTNGKITVDSLPFTEIVDADITSPNDNTIFAAYTKTIASTWGKTLEAWELRDGEVEIGVGAAAIGMQNNATGIFSSATGRGNVATGDYAHSEGRKTTASGHASHAEGQNTQATGYASHAEGTADTGAGDTLIASGDAAHAEGYAGAASGHYSHKEGFKGEAKGSASHAEGGNTVAEGDSSHAEGQDTQAIGKYSHSEGLSTKAFKDGAHAEGYDTLADGKSAHAEGAHTKAEGERAHAEGEYTTAKGDYSHAQGYNTYALGTHDFTSGLNTIAINANETVLGKNNLPTAATSNKPNRKYIGIWNATTEYKIGDCVGHNGAFYVCNDTTNVNIEPSTNTNSWTIYKGTSQSLNLLTIGNGADSTNRSNAATVDIYGNGWFAGTLTVTEDGVESQVATKADIEKLLDNPEGALDSILELAAAMEEHQNVVDALDDAIGNKADKSALAKVAFTGKHSDLTGAPALAPGTGENSLIQTGCTASTHKGSFAEGLRTTASNNGAHAEGVDTIASGDRSHAEGNKTIASGTYSHAQGNLTHANGNASFTAGAGTIAVNARETVLGSYNIPTVHSNDKPNRKYVGDWNKDKTYTNADCVRHNNKFYVCQAADNTAEPGTSGSNWNELTGSSASYHLLTIGNGNNNDERSNAATVDMYGNAWFAGNITVGENKTRVATIDDLQTFDSIILKSSTEGSNKKFRLTIDDNGVLSVAEVVNYFYWDNQDGEETILWEFTSNGRLTTWRDFVESDYNVGGRWFLQEFGTVEYLTDPQNPFDDAPACVSKTLEGPNVGPDDLIIPGYTYYATGAF